MSLLYLQGRGAYPDPPGDLVVAVDWPEGFHAPPLTPEWLAQPFPWQVDCVEAWLEDKRAAVGFSWGAWLLLCASVERAEKGLEMPHLLLLSAHLGEGRFTGSAEEGYRAPRFQRVRQALGLEIGTALTAHLPLHQLRLIHAVGDGLAPLARAQELSVRGAWLEEVSGGHLLDSKPARKAVATELRRLRMRLA